MKTDELLLEAIKKIEQGWCQGAKARDLEGEPIRPQGHAACSWSIIGALDARIMAPFSRDATRASNVLYSLTKEVDPVSLSAWNDAPERTKEEVIALPQRVRMNVQTK